QRRAGVAEQREHALLFDQLLGVGLRAGHGVAVIESDQLDAPAVHAAGIVDLLEVGERAVADVVAELGVAAGQRRRLADDDAARGNARNLLRLGGQGEASEGQSNESKHAVLPGRRLYRLTSVKAGGRGALDNPALPKITNGTTMPSDIEIAQAAKMKRIAAVAKEKLGIGEEHLEPYGHYKAKVSLKYLETLKGKKDGKLILVTAISPTPAGEGKTTTTVGLGDALNHISHGNELGIDIRRIQWKRVLDMNDRALRDITVGLGGTANGYPRQDGFDSVVASEVMAIFCLSTSLEDLKKRLGNLVVGYTRDQKPVNASDLGGHGAMTVLLKDALAPNLVQTLENNPAFVHGGPFANIAHGCNSVLATQSALKLADYVVTEAGFGADLGAEKFLDIKCRKTGL